MIPLLNTTGLIRTGHMAGYYVRVTDDRQVSGGYLVLFGVRSDFKEGYDEWIVAEEFAEYVSECRWDVAWEGEPCS